MKKTVLVGNLKKFGLDVSENIKDDAVVHRKSYDLVSGKELEGDLQTFLSVMSTATPDSDGEVIIPEGIDTTEYQRNPVLLWQHDRSQPCIGKCTETMVDKRGLIGSFILATTEFAQEVWQLVKGKFLSTVSIGFIPIESYRRGENGFNTCCQKYGIDPMNRMIDIITPRCLLLETSLVNLPSNRDAIIIAAKERNMNTFMSKMGVEEKVEVVEEHPVLQSVEVVEEGKIEDKKEDIIINTIEEPKVVIQDTIVPPKKISFSIIRNGPYLSNPDDNKKALLLLSGKIV
jgi:HK97 family phage prohead protease